MLEKLVSVYKLKERYGRLNDDLDPILTPTRKEPQCPYRLLYILFSDKFCEGLAQLGNVADQYDLDTCKASNNQLFWEGVEEAFKVPAHSETGNVKSNFSGHYQTYGINIQASCDHKCRFVYAGVAAPGGANDIAASKKTKISQMIQKFPPRNPNNPHFWQ